MLLTCKYFDITLRAVKYTFLRESRQTAYCLGRRTRRSTHIDRHLEIIGDIDAVAPSVERDALDIDACVYDLGAAASDGGRPINDALSPVREYKAQVAQAVLVCARVVNSVGVDADSLFYPCAVAGTKALVIHKKYLLKIDLKALSDDT